MLEAVRAFIQEHALLAAGSPVLVGVSGGLDSMVLLHVLHVLGYKPYGVHVNYGLRGKASDADEALVASVCTDLDVPFQAVARRVKVQGEGGGHSLQNVARDARYAVFADVARQQQIATVAVAHHQDDQAETVLLQLFRGTGLDGLAGMRPKRKLDPSGDLDLIRPLLGVARADLRTYAVQHNVPWREDASNTDSTYLRNRLRQDVMPLLEQYFGTSVPKHIAKTALLVQGYLASTIEPGLATIWNRARLDAADDSRLNIRVLDEQPTVWRQRVILKALRTWLPEAPRDAAFVARIDKLRTAAVGQRVESGNGIIWRGREDVIFDRRTEVDRSFSVQITSAGTYQTPEGTLHLNAEDVSVEWSGSRWQEVVDAEKLSFPLTLRYWEQGDRIQPLGMAQTKLVSDLLTDAKVPVHRRGQTLVVSAGNQVVWVVGQRLGHRFRVTPTTRCVVKMVFKPH